MAESEKGHVRRTIALNIQVQAIFDSSVDKIVNILRMYRVSPDKPFAWKDYPLAKKELDKISKHLSKELKALLQASVKAEYLGGLRNKQRIEQMHFQGKNDVLSIITAQQKILEAQRNRAVTAFTDRVGLGGFSLSQRVWAISQQAQKDMSKAIEAGLADGLDYQQLARNVKQYLNEPNRLFRRVRGKGDLLHLSRAAKNYHPGLGVYRSSVRNAQRVARTETNIAYRSAEYNSIQADKFILGIQINLSNNHTTKLPNGKIKQDFYDICDKLAGVYPKDFKFTGWHPHCRCFVTYIIVPQDEAMEMIRKGLSEPPRSKPIKDVPEQFKQWVRDNKERLQQTDNLPYFVRDNAKYFDGINFKDSVQEQFIQAEKFNKEIAPKMGYNGDKLGRKASAQAKIQLEGHKESHNYSEAQIENFKEIERMTGLKRGTPMTFEEADNGRANVYRDRSNCATCVVAHELRLRGFDITALPYDDTEGSMSRLLSENTRSIWLTAKGKATRIYTDWRKRG